MLAKSCLIAFIIIYGAASSGRGREAEEATCLFSMSSFRVEGEGGVCWGQERVEVEESNRQVGCAEGGVVWGVFGDVRGGGSAGTENVYVGVQM